MLPFSAKLADDLCLSLSSAGVTGMCSHVPAFYVGAGILTHVTSEPTPQAQMSFLFYFLKCKCKGASAEKNHADCDAQRKLKLVVALQIQAVQIFSDGYWHLCPQ